MPRDARPARPDAHAFAIGRVRLVGLVLPGVLTALSLAIVLLARPALPDPIAVHWGITGEPDGFGAVWMTLLLLIVTAFVLPAVLVGATLPAMTRGDRGVTFRFLGAMALGLSALICVLVTGTTLLQVGIQDAADGPSVLPVLAASLAAGIGAGIGGWYLQPAETGGDATGTPGRGASGTLALGAQERIVWMRATSISRPAAIVIAVALVVMAASAILVWIVGETATAWVVTALTLVVLVALAASARFHVRIDESGVTVTSVLGIPRFRVALADIASAREVTVSAMGEFGGYGLRWAPGRFGVIMGSGDALSVERRRGRAFVVTVRDAGTAADVLQALVDRANARG